MVKKFLFSLLIIGSVYALHAAKLASFPDIFKPIQVVIDDGTLYISDQCTILVYSMDHFKLKWKIGGKGEGPGEFQKTPMVKVLQDEILVHSYLKFCRFTKEGKLLMEKRFSTTMLSNIYPVGNNYIVDLSTFDIKTRWVREINIVDQNLEKIQPLYTHIKESKNAGGKRIISLINPVVFFQCQADRIFLANGYKGFFIEIFDFNGNSIGVIKKTFPKIKIPEAYKNKNKESILRKFPGSQKKRIEKITAFEFPEYFPPMQSFTIADDKIYVKTYGTKNKKEEYVILDLQGKFLKRVFLPGVTPGTIYNNKFYFLKDNEEKEEWELHCSEIK